MIIGESKFLLCCFFVRKGYVLFNETKHKRHVKFMCRLHIYNYHRRIVYRQYVNQAKKDGEVIPIEVNAVNATVKSLDYFI